MVVSLGNPPDKVERNFRYCLQCSTRYICQFSDVGDFQDVRTSCNTSLSYSVSVDIHQNIQAKAFPSRGIWSAVRWFLVCWGVMTVINFFNGYDRNVLVFWLFLIFGMLRNALESPIADWAEWVCWKVLHQQIAIRQARILQSANHMKRLRVSKGTVQ